MIADGIIREIAEDEADAISGIVRDIYLKAFLRGYELGWDRATYSAPGTRVQRAYNTGFKDGALANHDGAGWEELESFMDLEQREDLGLPVSDSQKEG